MPILVKLISGGVGLASEAYASRKQSKAAAKAAAADASSSSSSAAGPEPPQYAELPDSQAHDLIAKGHAVPVDAGSGSKDPDLAAAEPAVLDDDAVWALDEASEEHHRPSSPSAAPTVDISNNALIRDLLARLPPAPSPPPAAPLPCPVILPQRRPREKTRGFVRAYAPVLESAGIDQAAFLAFLKNFHAASQASPIFNVILLATAVVGMVPSTVVMATTAAINAVVIPAQIAQTRYRTNSFLDEANERLFKPRGLYAMIVAFRADADRPVEARALDVNAVLAKYGSAEGSGSKFKDGARKLRFSSAKTYGEAELPVAADLVFPGLEEEEGDEEAKKKMKATNKWLADYQDRRAQAKFLADNPDSSLIKQKPEFASALADPTHPAYQGNLVTLVSGGKIPPRERGLRGLAGAVGGAMGSRGGREEPSSRGGFGRGGPLFGRGDVSRGREGLLGGRGLLGRGFPSGGQGQHLESPSSSREASGKHPESEGYAHQTGRQELLGRGRGRGAGRGRTTIVGTVKKALQQDVLYLMVVNLPTDDEMAQAQVQLADLQAQTSPGTAELPA